jgi:hypoxanthine phosphoribosyltransferase
MPAEVWVDAPTIAATVHRIGAEISADHPGGLVLIGVLKGALVFTADVARAIDVAVEVDFIAISRFAPDSGRVRILHDVGTDLTDREVVLVEDVVDTGLTVAFLRHYLLERGARRVRVCTLVDRPGRRVVPEPADYVGFETDDSFLLGFGLHHHDLYRNLGFLARGERSELATDPGAYVPELYGRAPEDAPPAGGSVRA